MKSLQDIDSRAASPIAFSSRQAAFTLKEQARVLTMKIDMQLGSSDFEQDVGRKGV